MNADQVQQSTILNDGLFEFFVNHGVAAVFHHHNFAVVFL